MPLTGPTSRLSDFAIRTAKSINRTNFGSKAQNALIGGGTLSYIGGNIAWTQRFLTMASGKSADTQTGGFIQFTMPGAGTVIPDNTGTGNTTVVAAGIPMAAWDALYYILPIGGGTTGPSTNFRIVNYQHPGDFEIPANWVLVAIQSNDNASVRWGTGVITYSGQSWTSSNTWPGGTIPEASLPGRLQAANGPAVTDANSANYSGWWYASNATNMPTTGSYTGFTIRYPNVNGYIWQECYDVNTYKWYWRGQKNGVWSAWSEGAQMPSRVSEYGDNSITDWDNALTTGWYRASNAANSPNAPSTTWWIGEVVAHNNLWISQTVWNFTATTAAQQIWRRQSSDVGGVRTWSPWFRIRWAEADLDTRYSQTTHGHSLADPNITGLLPDAQHQPRLGTTGGYPVSDANTALLAGWWYADNAATNVPAAGGFWTGTTTYYPNAGYYQQEITCIEGTPVARRFWRICRGGVWYPWVETLHANNLPVQEGPDTRVKEAVKIAFNFPPLLTGTGSTFDGVTLAAGDRVLLTNQPSSADNGIYVVASGAWSRASDANTSAKIAGATVVVESGQMAGLWRNNFTPASTLGTTSMPWYRVYTTLDNLVPPTRMISVGDGLLGGGNLSNHVNIGMNFAANGESSDYKPVRADDSRLFDARTPTTHSHPVGDISATGTPGTTTYLRGDGTWTVPPNTTYAVPTQAEAEAGTATTGRAFSAQRVNQAIQALAPVKQNDPKLTDARTPLPHTHPSTEVTGLGNAATRNVGTASGTVAAGDDSRLSDPRTPTAHTHGYTDLPMSGNPTQAIAEAGTETIDRSWSAERIKQAIVALAPVPTPDWANITNKPTSFPPSTHSHAIGDLPATVFSSTHLPEITEVNGLSAALTGKQTSDATLTALANLSTTSDRLPYFTGVDTAAVTTFSSFARTLLAQTSASGMRSTLDVYSKSESNALVVPVALMGRSVVTAATTTIPRNTSFTSYTPITSALNVTVTGDGRPVEVNCYLPSVTRATASGAGYFMLVVTTGGASACLQLMGLSTWATATPGNQFQIQANTNALTSGTSYTFSVCYVSAAVTTSPVMQCASTYPAELKVMRQ